MKGSIGTQTSGSSARAAVRRNVGIIVKAKDIETAIDRGLYTANDTVTSILWLATHHASELNIRQCNIVRSVWYGLAEAGLLRGIRTSNPTGEGRRESEINQKKGMNQ